MNKREFNKLLNKISTNKHVDINKIKSLTEDEKTDMVHFIVRKRMPILKDLLPENFDDSWLCCMGYLYETKNKNYTFIHTSEHHIV